MNTTLVQIPLNQIKANPNNPRHVINPEAVEVTAASMKAVGQETPIKLRKLEVRSEELGSEHDQTSQYELIGGHIRLEAAKKLGWETLDALVLEVTPDQAELAAILDNEGEDMHWLDRYQAIESRMKRDPEPNQQEVADELGIGQALVSKALKTLKYLNQASRDLIYSRGIKFGDEEGVSGKVVLALSKLADAQKVEEALKVVIDKQMTEAQAKKLVESLNNPSAASSQPENSPGDPNADLWKPLPQNIKVTQTKKGYLLNALLSPSEVAAGVYGLMANLEHLKGQTGETEDPSYRNALPEIIHAGINAREEETKRQLEVKNQELAAKEAKQKAKVQKAEAKAQAKEAQHQLTQQQQEELRNRAKEALETHGSRVLIQMNGLFGEGALANMIYRAVEKGNKTKALSLAGEVLSHTDLPEITKKNYLGQVENCIKQWADLRKLAGVDRKLEVKSEESGVEGQEKPKTIAEDQQPGESELSGTEIAASLTPAYSAGIPRNDSETSSAGSPLPEVVAPIASNYEDALFPNDKQQPTRPAPVPTSLLDQVKASIKEQLKNAPEEIAEDLMRDGKSAANTVIKQAMRRYIKDMF